MTLTAPGVTRQQRRVGYLIGCLPLATQLFTFMSPTMIGPMFPWTPPLLLGVRATDMVFGLAMMLMVVGLVLIHRATSVRGIELALLTATLPATILAVFSIPIVVVVMSWF